jgi:hypothetical protein
VVLENGEAIFGQVLEPVLRSKNTWGKGALSLLRFFGQAKK